MHFFWIVDILNAGMYFFAIFAPFASMTSLHLEAKFTATKASNKTKVRRYVHDVEKKVYGYAKRR